MIYGKYFFVNLMNHLSFFNQLQWSEVKRKNFDQEKPYHDNGIFPSMPMDAVGQTC